jgi:hypothetical protein
VTEWITFASVVAGFLYQFITTQRQRRWDKEDREYHRAELAKKVETSAEQVSRQMTDENAKITAKIEENTTVNVQALTEANQVNLKLKQIGMAQLQLMREKRKLMDRRKAKR